MNTEEGTVWDGVRVEHREEPGNFITLCVRELENVLVNEPAEKCSIQFAGLLPELMNETDNLNLKSPKACL